MIAESPPVWVLADPRAGTAAQAIGIAERIGLPFRSVPLEWGGLARLPLLFGTLLGVKAALRGAFTPPWPQLVVSAGRRAGPVALWLGHQGVRSVHCMRFAGARGVDLNIIGRHDDPPDRPNVMPILGAAHRLSPARLAAARGEYAAFAELPSPRVALLVGGPVRAEGMEPGAARELGAKVAGFGGSVLATTSRRTGEAAAAALAESLVGVPHRLHRWGSEGPNPLLGMMAWADALVVTGDSVSMLSEALVTSAPVFVAPIGGEGKRHLALHASLYAAGQARPLTEAPAPFARPPLDEMGRIVNAIRARGLLG